MSTISYKEYLARCAEFNRHNPGMPEGQIYMTNLVIYNFDLYEQAIDAGFYMSKVSCRMADPKKWDNFFELLQSNWE